MPLRQISYTPYQHNTTIFMQSISREDVDYLRGLILVILRACETDQVMFASLIKKDRRLSVNQHTGGINTPFQFLMGLLSKLEENKDWTHIQGQKFNYILVSKCGMTKDVEEIEWV